MSSMPKQSFSNNSKVCKRRPSGGADSRKRKFEEGKQSSNRNDSVGNGNDSRNEEDKAGEEQQQQEEEEEEEEEEIEEEEDDDEEDEEYDRIGREGGKIFPEKDNAMLDDITATYTKYYYQKSLKSLYDDTQSFCSSEKCPKDHHEPLEKNGSKGKTKADFCHALNDLASFHHMDKKTLTAVLTVFNDFTSGLNLPLRTETINRKVAEDNTILKVPVNTMDNYIEKDNGSIKFDICVDECCVFAGRYKNLINCPVCNKPRYTRCYKCKKEVQYEQCNPFDDNCHHMMPRVPYATIYYRSISTMLYLDHLHCPRNLSFNETRSVIQGVYQDVWDDHFAKKNQEEMIKMCASRIENLQKQYVSSKVYHHALVQLSLFMDAKTMFDRSNESLVAGLITILNYPPTTRFDHGKGMKTAYLHNVKTNSAPDRWLKIMLVNELNVLYDGIVAKTGLNQYVFLAARLYNLQFDMKEWCSTMGYTSCWQATKYPCPRCAQIEGVSIAGINKGPVGAQSSYGGHAQFLPESHILRSFGQNAHVNCQCESPNCNHVSPPGYYLGKSDNLRTFQKPTLHSTPRAQLLPPSTTSTTFRKSLQSNLKVAKGCSIEVWPFTNQHFDDMKELIYGVYPNNTVTVYSRVSNADFQRRNSSLGKIKSLLANEKDKKVAPCLLALLKGFNFEKMAPWGPFHAMKNCCEYMTSMLTDESSDKTSVRSLCLQENRFSQIHSLKEDSRIEKNNQRSKVLTKQPHWRLSEEDIKFVDQVKNRLLLPPGISNDHRFTNPLCKQSFLQGYDKLLLYSVYLRFLLGFTKLHTAYKTLIELFGKLVAAFLSPWQTKSALKILVDKVATFLVLHELMLPSTLQHFVWHTLLCLSYHLRDRNVPCRSIWEMSGERALGDLCRFHPPGGLNHVGCIFDQAVAKEVCSRNNPKECKLSDKEFADEYLSKLQNIATKTSHSGNALFSIDDVLMHAMVQFVDVLGPRSDRAISRSGIYRLFYQYGFCIARLKAAKKSVDQELKSAVAGLAAKHNSKKNVDGGAESRWIAALENEGKLPKTPSTFYEFISIIRKGDGDSVAKAITTFHNLKLAELINDTDLLAISKCAVLLEDVTSGTIKKIWEFLQSPFAGIYKDGIIKGVHMTGRGLYTDETLNENVVCQHSTAKHWIKYDGRTVSNQGSWDRHIKYMELNYFFRLIIPDDPFLNEQIFACCLFPMDDQNKDLITYDHEKLAWRFDPRPEYSTTKQNYFPGHFIASTRVALSRHVKEGKNDCFDAHDMNVPGVVFFVDANPEREIITHLDLTEARNKYKHYTHHDDDPPPSLTLPNHPLHNTIRGGR